MTKGGIYNEILPEPEGNPEGKAQGISLYFLTQVTIQTFSITNPALTFLGNVKILNNTGELNFNIKMFSN